MGENKVIKQLTFGESEQALRAVDFLNKAGRSQSEAVVLALNLMIDKYNLKDASSKAVKAFIDNFDYVDSLTNKE